ncbi:MAG: tRNA G10 N-methylase Trm11 [Candidatus Methanohalarchaeum thermophilum]|uniref:tRNA G10 N-methylase Trm11 n=1 Tax=Methanohalarchaeum thermophilum TaxID=1903181 RepID=A0A1Q6DTD1_METT1|nr:MAG: tRNA G10 N-methylase Trm11 [Candidatus Methanohalarchaeum thermophilum]
MNLVFELSGEKTEIGLEEVKSVLEVFEIDYKVICFEDPILVIEVEEIDLNILRNRLAFTHSISNLISISENIEGLIDSASNLETDLTYSVRANQKKVNKPIKNMDVESKVGSAISGDVDLESPGVRFQVFITNRCFFLTEKFFDINKKEFRRRKPNLRPFFKPGAVKPKFARGIVNLLGLTKRDYLLDLFSGTGSYLLEASLIGCRAIGVDIELDMLEGMLDNFRSIDEEVNCILGDSRFLPVQDSSVDAVVMDPPYGRSSGYRAGSLSELYEKALRESIRVLRGNGRLCVITPKKSRFSINKGYKLEKVSKFEVRVHRNLTRDIKIFKRCKYND